MVYYLLGFSKIKIALQGAHKVSNMASIQSILEEKVIKELKYTKKPVSDQRKRFDKLKELCLLNNIQMKVERHFVSAIKIGLYRSSAGDDGEYHNDSFYVWAKPIIKHGRLFLSIKEVKKTIDASAVDCFTDIHILS